MSVTSRRKFVSQSGDDLVLNPSDSLVIGAFSCDPDLCPFCSKTLVVSDAFSDNGQFPLHT
jgi:hypothetical protein